MIFSEHSFIKIPKCNDCLIYFLIYKKEVVYVGQTHNGLSRPFSHHNKIFDEIRVFECNENELDILEDKFIQKYKPKYNKQSNYAIRWRLLRVRNSIREYSGIKNYTIPRLNKLLKKLNISPEIDCYNGNKTISVDEYNKIINYIKENGVI